MIKLVASTFAQQGNVWLFLDERLIADRNGVAEIELNRGQSYVLHWVVKADAGSTYSISISSPKEAQYLLTRMVGPEGKDVGGFKFST